MLPEVWGPPHWDFFHTFSENIHESSYSQVGPILFIFIVRICRNLPCPECSSHASRFLAKINIRSLKTKSDLKNLMYIFHNFVNKRKNKLMFPQTELENKYKRKNIVDVFKRFLRVFNTRGNMNLLSESFQRDFVIRDLKSWFKSSAHHFVPLVNPSKNLIQPTSISKEETTHEGQDEKETTHEGQDEKETTKDEETML